MPFNEICSYMEDMHISVNKQYPNEQMYADTKLCMNKNSN